MTLSLRSMLFSLAATLPLPALLASVPLAAPSLQEAARSGARAPRRTELAVDPAIVPLELASGWPVVEVSFGGRGPYRMLVDTGAARLVLYGDLARELGLEPVGQARIGDPTDPGANLVDLVRVPELSLGDAYFEDVEAVSWADPVRAGDVRGIVGLPVFAGCTVTLDYPDAELRMTRAPLAGGTGVQELVFDAGGILLVPIEVAGRAYEAHLDSGNSSSLVLPGRLLDELAVVAGTQREGRGRRANGEVRFVVGTLDGEVRFAGATFARPEVRFDPGLPFVNVGHGVLREFAVTIDQPNGRIAFARAGAAAARAPSPAGAAPPGARPTPGAVPAHGERRRLGVEMVLDGDPAMRVRSVQAGSPAERAGVRAGDVLRAVDGETIDHERTDALVRALADGGAFALTLARGGETVTVQVPGEERPAPPGPDARLDELLGSYRVQGHLEHAGGREPLAGEARFERVHDGRFVRETFELRHGARTFSGEAYFAWREAAGRYELTQLDTGNPVTPWLVGSWLDDPGVLRFESVAAPAAATMRWDYSFVPAGGGAFTKRILTPDAAGELVLRSEYRYERVP